MALRPSSCARRPTPDLVLMDLHHAGDGRRRGHAPDHGQHAVRDPDRDGERRTPTPRRVFEAMGHGALDAVDTPDLGSGESAAKAPHRCWRRSRPSLALLGEKDARVSPRLDDRHARSRSRGDPLVAIGASAGGPAALADRAARPATGFSGRDRRHSARRRAVRRRHGGLVEPAVGAAGDGRRRRRSARGRHGAARRHERPSGA